MKTLMRTAGPAALCALALAGAAPAAVAQTAAPAAADTMFRTTTLNLSAYGEARVAPDKASITLGVMTEAPTASAAMEQNRVRMTEVIAALKRAGIAERDVQTSGLNLNPQYAYRENEPPRLTGYQASNQVTITVNDLNRLGAAIDATVSAGANQIQGISFGLKDPSTAENQARLDAVKALQAKASLYAQATGHRVSRLVSLSEGGGYAPPPPMPVMAMARAEKFDASTPVQPGQLTVRVDITGLYELAR
jgi:uncharacterized protein YggE